MFSDFLGDSSRLITGSADQTAKLWDVKSGKELFTFKFNAPTRSVDFAVGDRLAVITTDHFVDRTAAIHVKRIAEDPEEQDAESVLVLHCPDGKKRINRAVWGPLNQTIVSGGEDKVIRIWDAETGKLLKQSDEEVGHKKDITSLCKAADDSHFLTGSLDKTAKACASFFYLYSISCFKFLHYTYRYKSSNRVFSFVDCFSFGT